MAAPSADSTEISQTISDFIARFPKESSMGHTSNLYKWEGSWYIPMCLEGALAVKSNFEARDDDIILATSLKVGTTWFKALLTAIMSGCHAEEEDSLIKENPHDIVRGLEYDLYRLDGSPDLSDSIKNSKCKIVYIARNPKDTFVSLYHFLNTLRTPEQGPYLLDNAFDGFCKGIHLYGPYLDHVLGYWNHSLKNVDKFLFIKYEEMKIEPKVQVNKLAEFLGKSFRSDEERDQVLWRCSIERLQRLEVNVKGATILKVPNYTFFRLGVVGDWKNTLTSEMGERLDQVTRAKLEGSGLNFDV